MLSVFKNIWNFSGSEQGRIKKSIILGFIFSIFNALSLSAIFVVLDALINKKTSPSIALLAFVLMLISVIGQIITKSSSQLDRVHAGFFMSCNKRIEIGNKLKNVPMGYFSENNLGQITAISTTILSDVENTAPVVLIKTLGGFINSLIFNICIYIFDIRIGLIVSLTIVIFLFITSLTEKKSKYALPRRQKAQENLISAVLETIQGMSVVKAFNLTYKKNKRVDKAIDASCAANKNAEFSMLPFLILQQLILYIFSTIIIFLSIKFYLNGTMSLVYALMMIICSFIIFNELKEAGLNTAIIHLTQSSIDRANYINDVPIMSEGKNTIAPKNHDICFNKVNFAYDKRPILNNISFKIPEKTMTAIIGPSGSGKTTLCNLITRFWDVNSGSIEIGGQNIKDYTLSNLMKNVSIVFQNIYLFADTIENNIKFGKQNATHKEVVSAAKSACCHDFIESLPNGYNTLIGESGSSLSGGEKQRISIARAILKNAPIIIFDEATANVDPENEDKLQKAIEHLTKNKTIIMIAHRLKTVRNSDQILVLNKGKIVQKGTHNELITQKGIYSNFVTGKKSAIGWKLKPEL